MVVELGRTLTNALRFGWSRRWLWWLGIWVSGGQSGLISYEILALVLSVLVFLLIGVMTALQVPVAITALLTVVLVVAMLVGLLLLAATADAAMIWCAIELDNGREPRPGDAWREGWRRKSRFSGVILLRIVVAGIPIVLLITVILGVAALTTGSRQGPGVLGFVAIIGSELLVIALVYAGLLIFGWAPQLALIADLPPLAAFRASWRMVRRHPADSVVLFVLTTFAIPLGFNFVLLLALVVSLPGIILAIVGFGTHGLVILGVVGVMWIAIIGIGTLLVGSGLLGAIEQIAYSIACRQLAIHDGLVPGVLPVPESPPSTGLPAPVPTA